jgi:hypothetical protein
MLHRVRSRQSQHKHRQASLSFAAPRGELGLASLQLELPHPDQLARLPLLAAAPAEKPAGSCVIVVNLCGDDSDEE